MGSICESVPTVMSSSSASTTVVSSVPPFLSKTYDMVDDPSSNEVVSWSSGNNSFVVWNVPEFAKHFLPKYFKHKNFSSFVRQLNTYGFRKVDPDRWEFANEGFLRGQKQLLKSIVRRKPAQVQPPQQPQVQHSSVGACVEVGKFGLEEEVERLQRDKNVLMQELVRLRQQQQVTEHHLQNVGQKVHVMEQRQQQMMSFLAKAVQSPGFLNQFAQQNNEGNQHISESNKKRRLPVEDQKNNGSHGVDGLSCQIVRYQSSMNESANSMLQQIQNMSNSYSRHELLSNNHGSFLSGDVPTSNLSDNGSSSNGASGVAFADVSSNPAHSYPAMKHHDPCTTNQLLETNLPYPQADLLAPKQGSAAASGSPNSDVIGYETDNGECLDPIMAILDGSMILETDGAINELIPGVQDSLWEQFFGESPGIGDSDELVSGSVDNELIMEQLELQSNLRNVLSNNQQMNHLTEQMGLLTSDALRK